MIVIKELFDKKEVYSQKSVELIARVQTNRAGKEIGFLVINDGTTINDVQVVYKSNLIDYEKLTKARISSIIEVKGKLVLTPNKPQPFEISAEIITILDQAIEEYPLQKKEHSYEFLREIAHLRARTKTFNAVFRIRSAAAYAIHRFYQKKGFIYLNTPIITGNDAEGAGETFTVTTITDDHYEKDFFGKKASLTVSGQLNGEAFAQAFKQIYTFGPTFRAENSNTTKHAAEFWMIEPEIAFADLQENIKVMEEMLKSIVNYILDNYLDDINYLTQNIEPTLLERMNGIKNAQFATVTYIEAIETLIKAVQSGHEFDNNDIEFGLDLGTEHERYLCEVVYKKPTFVINFPKTIKAFYMKQNDDNKTVAAVDLLVPGIGELIGGSQREDSYEKLMKRCQEMDIPVEDLEWYLDLRKFGYYKSSGFGLGFERLVMYLTGMGNIRDVIPFPRTPRNLLF